MTGAVTYKPEYLGRYAVFVDGEYVGHVTKTREAIASTRGSRVRSGRERTVWLAGTAGYGYPTRKQATDALRRAMGR